MERRPGMTTRALVLRAPGINCDRETAHACRLVGFTTDLLHINQLLKDPERLLDYALLVIPGGFSYGDDLGAGTLLAKNLTVHLGPQLERFIAEGRLILGICNGFQVLVKAGLLPGSFSPGDEDAANTPVAASLTDNASAQFECRWVPLDVQPGKCIFTQGIDHPFELSVAHGEGQFVLAREDLASILKEGGYVPLVYASPTGETVAYPDNPNGSIANIAGVCNASGHIFGLMPHPERYVSPLQHPLRKANADGEGDGLLIFKNAYTYAQKLHISNRRGHPAGYNPTRVEISPPPNPQKLKHAPRKSTPRPPSLAGMGAFARGLNASSIQQMDKPALVSSTDGVGTKNLLSPPAGRLSTLC